MKGLNAMTGVLIMLLIAMTVFAWISTNQTVGENTFEEVERTALISEADRRLERANLLMENIFLMSAQRGSALAANNSGRVGEDSANSYWMCKGDKQLPEREEVSYSVSNFTEKITEERISEVRGLRNNWIYEVEDLSCVETGYNEPLASSENDHFFSSARLGSIKVQDRGGRISREINELEFRRELKYNRYWHLYSTMKEWTQDQGHRIDDSIKEELSKVDSGQSRSSPTCVTESGPDPGEVCSGDLTAPGPDGTYPDAMVCQDVVSKAELAVSRGISNKIEELEEEHFDDGQVSCGFSFNENNLGQVYPGIDVSTQEQRSPKETSSSCAEDTDQEGKIYDCVNSWRHYFEVKADFQITCTDNKFTTIPGKKSLEPLKWKVNMSLSASGPGNDNGALCNERGSSNPPDSFNSCQAESFTNQCSNSVDLRGSLE